MNGRLLRLRDKSNTVLVVENKPEAIVIADRVVDLGPDGGEVVFGDAGLLDARTYLDVAIAALAGLDEVTQS
jgi:hypothetical protein